MPFNSKQANVNKFTIYFSPICSFVSPAIFESWLRLLRNQHGPVRIIRRRFTSSTKSPSFPPLSGLELFASISHLREAREVKLSRLELKPPILIIVTLHIYFHSHDKIAIFTRANYFYHGWMKFYLFDIVTVFIENCHKANKIVSIFYFYMFLKSLFYFI